MSDKPLLQSGSAELRVGTSHVRREGRRTHYARMNCPANALGTSLALPCAVRTKETR